MRRSSLTLGLALACAMACNGSSTVDPFSATLDPATLETVAVRIVTVQNVRADPKRRDLNDVDATHEPDAEFIAKLLERRRGWVRLGVDATWLRFVVWVPDEQVEFVGVESLDHISFDLQPSASDASWVEVSHGTRILDAPDGEPFAVVLQDSSLHWCGGQPEDDAVEVCLSSRWGELRGYVQCPCRAIVGAGG